MVTRENAPNIAGFCFVNQERVREGTTARVDPRKSDQETGWLQNQRHRGNQGTSYQGMTIGVSCYSQGIHLSETFAI
jgi:hypothetical protein